jgi:hypothetical protein
MGHWSMNWYASHFILTWYPERSARYKVHHRILGILCAHPQTNGWKPVCQYEAILQRMGSSVCDSSAPDANYLKMQGFVCYAQVCWGPKIKK